MTAICHQCKTEPVTPSRTMCAACYKKYLALPKCHGCNKPVKINPHTDAPYPLCFTCNAKIHDKDEKVAKPEKPKDEKVIAKPILPKPEKPKDEKPVKDLAAKLERVNKKVNKPRHVESDQE